MITGTIFPVSRYVGFLVQANHPDASTSTEYHKHVSPCHLNLHETKTEHKKPIYAIDPRVGWLCLTHESSMGFLVGKKPKMKEFNITEEDLSHSGDFISLQQCKPLWENS